MKLRIVIKGPKVHNVGYRYFLMTLARRARIRYFDAENIDGAVEVLVESDDEKITAFKKLVETSRPDRAEVSAIAYEEYDGEIWPISEYSQFCTNVQLNKAIPILLNIVEHRQDGR
jgi:acylphosphatase